MRLIFVIKFYGGGIVIGRERSRQIQSVRGNAAFSFLFVNVKKAKRLKMDGRLNFKISKNGVLEIIWQLNVDFGCIDFPSRPPFLRILMGQ